MAENVSTPVPEVDQALLACEPAAIDLPKRTPISELERSNAQANAVRKARSDLRLAQADIKTKDDIIAELRAQLAARDRKIETLETAAKDDRDAFVDASTQLEAANKDRRRLENDLMDKDNAHAAALERQQAVFNRTIDILQTLIRDGATARSELEVKVAELKVDIAKPRLADQTLEMQTQLLVAEKKSLELNLSLERELRQKAELDVSVQADLNSLKADVSVMKNSMTTLDSNQLRSEDLDQTKADMQQDFAMAFGDIPYLVKRTLKECMEEYAEESHKRRRLDDSAPIDDEPQFDIGNDAPVDVGAINNGVDAGNGDAHNLVANNDSNDIADAADPNLDDIQAVDGNGGYVKFADLPAEVRAWVQQGVARRANPHWYSSIIGSHGKSCVFEKSMTLHKTEGSNVMCKSCARNVRPCIGMVKVAGVKNAVLKPVCALDRQGSWRDVGFWKCAAPTAVEGEAQYGKVKAPRKN